MNPAQVLPGFERVAACIPKVVKLRRWAWEKICRHTGRTDELLSRSLAGSQPRVCILASSSRGGTSVTAELLQWQGAECANPDGRLLTLPGEEKPLLILAGLAFPSRPQLFDDLSELDADSPGASDLRAELISEIGSPMKMCDDLELYACQLYRRLLLQWPIPLTEMEPETAIACLSASLRDRFPHGYKDNPDNRQTVLLAAAKCFPFVRRSYYDCWKDRDDALQDSMTEATSIEEMPFIFPPPWNTASRADYDRGCLLLRDPSNAWRLPFWRKLFKGHEMKLLHLVRDPRESIQGLCDGWNYHFGFQTMPASPSLDVPGYTDRPGVGNSIWKRHRLNFSISESLSRLLSEHRRPMSLVETCGYQWKDAHETILAESRRLGLSRTVVNFADVRDRSVDTFKEICEALRLACTDSGLTYALSLPSRWIMATIPAGTTSRTRWRNPPFASEIDQLTKTEGFRALAMELGIPYTPENDCTPAAPESHIQNERTLQPT
jgi:hypothetical protein